MPIRSVKLEAIVHVLKAVVLLNVHFIFLSHDSGNVPYSHVQNSVSENSENHLCHIQVFVIAK